MTKAAVAGELPSSSVFPFGGGGGLKIPSATMKRKTPSELRGELLMRKNLAEMVDESSVPKTGSMSNADGTDYGFKKPDILKVPRYIDTRLPYPVTKNSIKHRLFSRKDNQKETVSIGSVGSLNNSCVPMNLYAKREVKDSRLDDTMASEGGKECSSQANNTTKECNNVTFPSLRGPFLVGEKSNGSSDVDMDEVLKGVLSYQLESVDRKNHILTQTQCSEFLLPGHRIPLDLTLKTSMRLQSSSSVNWFHRLVNCGTLYGIAHSQSQNMTCSSGPISSNQVTNPGTFHSWVHPQSTLPRPVISALTMAGGQLDFLLKRHQAWEDSFRNLYYMFRKKICQLFYVCNEQFVVLFTGSNASNETKGSCYAYVSQSTTSLRSLLKKHDISFSMPLCLSKVEEVTSEDLVELSEIAKHNLGQTRAIETMSGVDNSPQSLLMFTGNKSVHGLYDFMLNYRSFLTFLTSDDVPVLYSPVPFENAAPSAPEIRCKEVRKLDYISKKDSDPNSGSTASICYTIEIKDAYIPPWIIRDICNAMRCNGGIFEASFTTKSSTIGLNVGLGVVNDQPLEQVKVDEPTLESDHSFGISNATVSRNLHSAYLNGLKYCDDSYTASLSRVI